MFPLSHFLVFVTLDQFCWYYNWLE